MPLNQIFNKKNSKILLLGSGALSIGQAGEFDYSGTQALNAFLEEDIEIILVNPNIATVQTNIRKNCKVYLYPITPHWVTKIIRSESPTAIVGSFGGQTALNCLLELETSGILKKYHVSILGTSTETIILTEDRILFSQTMQKLDLPVVFCIEATSLTSVLSAAEKIGYPVILRSSFSLGGLGSGVAHNSKELNSLAKNLLSTSPQILIEKSLTGYKEIEYEIMRDSMNNTIAVCNMENIDPLGVHTGDSIVIVPSQTLSNDDYQLLRDTAIRVAEYFQIIGECNIQFAMDPKSQKFFIIELNARLSRSSALASKASGYPIAFLAAKIILGYSLIELKNPSTKCTSAFFEPSFDYVAIKFPKWEFSKFPDVDSKLDTSMKSVGEVMGIGRSFAEAFQKSIRMVNDSALNAKTDFKDVRTDNLFTLIQSPNDKRIFAVMEALYRHIPSHIISKVTHIDTWFIHEINEIIEARLKLESYVKKCFFNFLDKDIPPPPDFVLQKFCKILDKDDWTHLKQSGFSDEQIVSLVLSNTHKKYILYEQERQELSFILRKSRISANVVPVIKKIDTTSAEYQTSSNYLYMTYEGCSFDVLPLGKKSILILGGGPYTIGSSVEFDWCAVSCSDMIRKNNYQTILINCNPETVSTDYNSSDRLYFEELTLERILDIIEFESPIGVIISMGGQVPNNLSFGLQLANVKILGHSHKIIKNIENRSVFASILKKKNIEQPRFQSVTNQNEIEQFIKEVHFPVLVRPDFVLSGRGMKISSSKKELFKHIQNAQSISHSSSVLLTEYFEEAQEIELDGVAQNGRVLVSILSAHLENAGIHSGDAIHVLPARFLSRELIKKIKDVGKHIIKQFIMNGPFNLQFLIKDNQIKVIECNCRASRTFPFVSKVSNINLAELSALVFLGVHIDSIDFDEISLKYYGVKASKFSFNRLPNADPLLGVEMLSTGEVGCIFETFLGALALALESVDITKPQHGFLIHIKKKKNLKKLIRLIPYFEKFSLPIYTTPVCAQFLQKNSINLNIFECQFNKVNNIRSLIQNKKIDLYLNIPMNYRGNSLSYESQIRIEAVKQNCTVIHSIEFLLSSLQAYCSDRDALSKVMHLKRLVC